MSKENSFLYFENIFINFGRPFSLVKRQIVTNLILDFFKYFLLFIFFRQRMEEKLF